MQATKKNLPITLSIFLVTVIASNLWFMLPPVITNAENENTGTTDTIPLESHKEGNHVVIYLHEMKLELRNGKEVLQTFPLLSQGKPGSYYETIGGEYENDYKTPLHFSSIGYVYMPYSVHLFGNYFIHGVPYYPNGQKVSSAYSGGCIRLADTDAKVVYDFINRGTTIIITRGTDSAFKDTEGQPSTLMSQKMTNMMVTIISLEALTQDNEILDTDRMTLTTRKTILPRLIKEGDSSVSLLYANSIGEQAFINLMNQKATSLGLTNTHFTSVISPVSTTYEDYARLMTYIDTYKSYIRTLEKATSPSL